MSNSQENAPKNATQVVTFHDRGVGREHRVFNDGQIVLQDADSEMLDPSLLAEVELQIAQGLEKGVTSDPCYPEWYLTRTEVPQPVEAIDDERFMTYGPANDLYEAIRVVLKNEAKNLSAESLALLNGAVAKVKDAQEERKAYADEIKLARAHDKVDDDLEIDDDPVLSVADDGVWVSSWIWIRIDAEDDEG